MNQGPIWGRLLKKTRGRQSRAIVPLKGQAPQARSSPNLIPPGAISRGSAAIIAEAFAWPTFTHSGRGAPESWQATE